MLGRLSILFLITIILCASCTRFRRVPGRVYGTEQSYFVSQRIKCFRYALEANIAVLQITERGATSYECQLFTEVTHVMQESELHMRTFVVDLRSRGDTCPAAYETIAEHLAIKWVYEPSEAIEKLEQVAVFQITEHGATSYECRLFTEFTHVMQESELHTRTFVVDLRPRTDTCPAAYDTIAEHLAVAWVYKPNEAIRKSLIALKKIEKTEVRNRARRLCFVALTTRRLELQFRYLQSRFIFLFLMK